MKVRDVVTLKEVADDLNDGKTFYDQRESGVGDYFFLVPTLCVGMFELTLRV